MFLEMGSESGENRVGTVLLVHSLGEGQADAPDRLTDALGGLERLIIRAVVDVGQSCLKLGEFLLGDFLFLIGRIVAGDGCPAPGHLPEVMLGDLRIVERGGTLLDRCLTLDPGEQIQRVDRLAGMLEIVAYKIHASSVNERSRRAVVGKGPGTLAFLEGVSIVIRAMRREECH